MAKAEIEEEMIDARRGVLDVEMVMMNRGGAVSGDGGGASGTTCTGASTGRSALSVVAGGHPHMPTRTSPVLPGV